MAVVITYVNAASRESRQITFSATLDWDSRFLPTGDKIVFTSVRDRREADLFLIDVDGSHLQQLTRNAKSYDFLPRVTHDGQSIVFARGGWFGRSSPIASRRWHDIALCMIDLEGGPVKRLLEDTFYDIGSISPAPDNTVLFTDGLHFWGDNAWYADLRSSSSKQQVRPIEDWYYFKDEGRRRVKNILFPSFSPDGSIMLFGVEEIPSQGIMWRELHLMNWTSREAKKVTNLQLFIVDAQFSQDGRRIAFVVDPTPGFMRESERLPYEAWVMDANGTNVKRIAVE